MAHKMKTFLASFAKKELGMRVPSLCPSPSCGSRQNAFAVVKASLKGTAPQTDAVRHF
jgi:hypothetical protein